jgi:hypothetical protein
MVSKIRDGLNWLTTFLFVLVVGWYLLLFTPTKSVEATFSLQGGYFTYTSWAHKTALANLLCGKPVSFHVVFTDPDGNSRKVLDNAKGFGTGNRRTKKFVSTGIVPKELTPGTVSVEKQLIYKCIFGITKDVRTLEQKFELRPKHADERRRNRLNKVL